MIFAQKGDSLADLIGRVMESSDREVSVVIPFGFEALRSEEDFFRLFEEARAAGKIVSILSDDEHMRVRAKHIGFRVGSSQGSNSMKKEKVIMTDIVRKAAAPQTLSLAREVIPDKPKPVEKPRITIKKSEQIPSAVMALEPRPEIPGEEPILEPPQRFALRVPPIRIPAFFRSSLGLTLVLTLVGLGIAAGVLGIVLPSVEVDITPRTEELDLAMELVVAVNPQEGEIPAQFVSVEKSVSQKAPATQRSTTESRAQGTVRIYNAYGPDSQTLVATTRLVSQEGKLFRTTETVVVPGGSAANPSSIAVSVVAAEAGPEYNISPSTFSIPGFQGTPKYQGFYGKSDEPMRGGASGDVRVVSEDDIAKATEGLEARAQEEIEKEFTAKLPPGFVVFDEARMKSIVMTADSEAGDPADEVTATAEAKLEALLFKESDVTAQAEALIMQRLGENIQVVPGTLSLSYTVHDRSFDQGRMGLSVQVLAQAARRIDANAFAEVLAGKSEPEIRSFLGAHEDVKFAKVRFSPFFISRAPKDPDRIFINVSLDTQ